MLSRQAEPCISDCGAVFGMLSVMTEGVEGEVYQIAGSSSSDFVICISRISDSSRICHSLVKLFDQISVGQANHLPATWLLLGVYLPKLES